MTRTRWARILGVLALVVATGSMPIVSTDAATRDVAHRSARGTAPGRTNAVRRSAARTVRIVVRPNGVVNGFSPKTTTISRGTSITLVNRDRMRHTMTSSAKDSRGNPLFSTAAGPKSSVTVAGISGLAAGRYPFYCSVHPNMRGTLVVKGKPGGTTGAGTTYTQPLVVPTQLTGSTVRIPVENARVRMLPTGSTTPMLTFGATYPGPTVRRTAGQATKVVFTDRLGPSTGAISVHLHGDHHSSADDGQPSPQTGNQTNTLLDPGATRTYHYSLTEGGQPARSGFDFYHDHTMGRTAHNNWLGLQGMFIVDSPAEQALGLPSGPYDVPLMVSDRSFTGANRLTPQATSTSMAMTGPSAPPNDTTVGTHILVNGRYLPYFAVAAHRYRLRLLNSSLYQSYDFALSDGQSFRQVGTGDGLLPRAVMRPDILLGPSQRADVIVDFAGDLHKNVVLRSVARTDNVLGAVGSAVAPLLQFRVNRSVRDHSKAPYHLEPAPAITVPSTVSQTWAFDLGGNATSGTYWTVNGRPYDPSRVDYSVAEGSTQLWTLRNDSNVTHYIHLHEEQWHTIARIDANGVRTAPPPWEQGLEDTWRLDPHTSVEVAATFTDFPGIFMIHCHMLDHEDDGMMAQFAVVNSAGPGLPAGFHYAPLSKPRDSRPGTSVAGTSMPGMSMPAATTPTATPPTATAPTATSPAWFDAGDKLVRSIGVEIVLALLVAVALRTRRRRRSS